MYVNRRARNAWDDGKKNDAKLMKINCLIKLTVTSIGSISLVIISLFHRHADNIKIIIVCNVRIRAFNYYHHVVTITVLIIFKLLNFSIYWKNLIVTVVRKYSGQTICPKFVSSAIYVVVLSKCRQNSKLSI